MRCRKVGRACQGYRQETDLLFKDETLTTIERATNALLRQAVPKKVLAIPMMDQSLCLFFATYIADPQNEDDLGYLDYLPTMYLEADEGSSLVETVHAVALTYMYNKGSDVKVKQSARRHYGNALKTINETLQNPIKRLTDGTLLSIWLIQIYEARSPGRCCFDASNPFIGSYRRAETGRREDFSLDIAHGRLVQSPSFERHTAASDTTGTSCLQCGLWDGGEWRAASIT
jgi:hypothetical protein